MLFLQGTSDSHSQQQEKKEHGSVPTAQQDSVASIPVPGPPPPTPPHTPPTPLSPPPSPPPTQHTSTHVFNQSTHSVHLSTPPQSADMSQSSNHPHAPTPEKSPSTIQKGLSSKLPLPSLQPDGSAQKLAAAASVSKRSSSVSSSSSSSSSVSPASIPSPSPPKRSASSSAPRAHRSQQSNPRPSGVPVLEPPALQPSLSSKTRQSPASLPLKPHSTAPKSTTRGPHTPPEQSPSRPGVHQQLCCMCLPSITRPSQPTVRTTLICPSMGSSSSNMKRSTLVSGPAKQHERGRRSMEKG